MLFDILMRLLEKYMNVIPIHGKHPEPTTEDVAIRNQIAKAVSSWFVRRDGKFYDIDNLNVALSKPDVQRVCLFRIRDEYPEIQLASETLKAVFNLAIEKTHADHTRSIPVWNGRRQCHPANPQRIIHERGEAIINTWKRPAYRELSITDADYGIAGEFLEQLFPRDAEREMILDWLSWNFQNEDDKPTWAPFLYSRTKGSGKSTFCHLASVLFGLDNSVTQNNVDQLTSRFNMTALHSKLVISEELQLRQDSTQSNTLKTYITEKTTLSEFKGRESERVDQRCCFVFTTNHLPLWIEAEDRRYYVVEVDHEGHAAGPQAAEFASLVGELMTYLDKPVNVARLYNALLARELPETFSAKTLNVARDATDVMQRIHDSSRQVTLDQLDEHLNEMGVNAIPEANLVEFINNTLRGNANSLRHMMAGLGWSKSKVKWGGVDYARAIWIRPGFSVDRGKLHSPDGSSETLTQHLDRDAIDVTL